ncbi:MAG: hypothetical protein AAB659_00620 [Patescibacteria group bacterium]
MALAERPNIHDHTREISFAVFRVAKLIENPKLKKELEESAIELVSKCGEIPYVPYIPEGETLPYLPYIEKLVNLVKLAEIVGEVKSVNSKVLLRELGILKSAIIGSLGKKEDIDLAESFARPEPAERTELPSVGRFSLPPSIKHEKPNVNIAIRQSAIIAFIRGLPNGCRMRDLLTKFPEVSERTLRNDLQDLNAGGLVERLGKGASSSFRGVTKHEIIAL